MLLSGYTHGFSARSLFNLGLSLLQREWDAVPKKTAVPMACRLAVPAPVAFTRGRTPRMKANDVMRMGRRRSRAASTTASTIPIPFSRLAFANSTMRMAFLAPRPTRRTRTGGRSFHLASSSASSGSLAAPFAESLDFSGETWTPALGLKAASRQERHRSVDSRVT